MIYQEKLALNLYHDALCYVVHGTFDMSQSSPALAVFSLVRAHFNTMYHEYHEGSEEMHLMTTNALTSPWNAETIAELDTVLASGVSLDVAVRWLQSRNTDVPRNLCELAVISALECYWHQLRVIAAKNLVAERDATWEAVASVTGCVSAVAAQRFYNREAGTLAGYNPKRRNAKTPRSILPCDHA